VFGGTGATAVGAPAPECTSWTGGLSWTATPATNGLPWCLEATTASDEVKLRGGGCGSATRAIRFTFDFTSAGSCVYQRATSAVGAIGTDVSGQDATFSITEQEWILLEGGFSCPSSGRFVTSFTFETDVVGASPVYFSS
jgi:hypothetical protein